MLKMLKRFNFITLLIWVDETLQHIFNLGLFRKWIHHRSENFRLVIQSGQNDFI